MRNAEDTILTALEEQLRLSPVRSAIERVTDSVVERALSDQLAPMIWKTVPLDAFPSLPAGILSSWVFFLRSGITTEAERHSNSRQRMMSWQGYGDLQVGGDGAWRSHPLISDPAAPMDRRWISIPEGSWHRAVVPADSNWIVVSFHTVVAGDLHEERAHGRMRYLDAEAR